jgi:hypothetical protein
MLEQQSKPNAVTAIIVHNVIIRAGPFCCPQQKKNFMKPVKGEINK